MKASIVLVTAAFAFSGCADEFRQFPTMVENGLDRPLHLEVEVALEDDKNFTRLFELAPGQTFHERWRIPAGTHEITVRALNMEETQPFDGCATYRLEIGVNETRIALDLSQSSGYTGC